jgi:hypothetical protein
MSLTRIARTEVNRQLTAGSQSGLVRKGHGFQNRNRNSFIWSIEPATELSIPYMCGTGTRTETVLIYFWEPFPKVLHKSKELHQHWFIPLDNFGTSMFCHFGETSHKIYHCYISNNVGYNFETSKCLMAIYDSLLDDILMGIKVMVLIFSFEMIDFSSH